VGEFTDRDVCVATLTLLIGLAERLTGERVTVFLRNEKGEVCRVGADPDNVVFEATKPETPEASRPYPATVTSERCQGGERRPADAA
jgi:hypothetical protein